MPIHSENRIFHILRTISKTETEAVYLCTDISEKERCKYILNGLLTKEYYKYQIPLFMDLKKNKSFTDYIECFSAEGVFYLLFRYFEGRPFSARISAPLETRLDDMRKLIEKMVLTDMPFFLQKDMLNMDRIYVTDDGKVEFLYILAGNTGMEEADARGVELCLLELVKRTFENELKTMRSGRLTEFCDNLSSGAYSGYTDIYESFSEVCKVLSSQDDGFISNRYGFCLWETLKKHGKKIKNIVLISVGILIAAMLVYETLHTLTPHSESPPIEKIGTLPIKENQTNNN